jgi:hypothetical protein
LRRHEPNISRRPAEVGWRSVARRAPVGVDGVAVSAGVHRHAAGDRRAVKPGLYARVAQRLLATGAAIWHNWATGTAVKRSLTAYDN